MLNKTNKMEKKFFKKTLAEGFVVSGMAYHLSHLGSKFQIKCRDYGLSDAESLACWISKEPEAQVDWFGSQTKAGTLATSGFKKLTNNSVNTLNLE